MPNPNIHTGPLFFDQAGNPVYEGQHMVQNHPPNSQVYSHPLVRNPIPVGVTIQDLSYQGLDMYEISNKTNQTVMLTFVNGYLFSAAPQLTTRLTGMQVTSKSRNLLTNLAFNQYPQPNENAINPNDNLWSPTPNKWYNRETNDHVDPLSWLTARVRFLVDAAG